MVTESELLRRQKISKTLKSSPKVKRGKDHPFWKGDDVSYSSLHEWLVKYKPSVECCEECGKKRKLDIANISGEYRRDVDDYKWLCRSCHKKKDFNYETYDGGFKIRPLSFWKNKKMPESVTNKMSKSQKNRPPMSKETKYKHRIAQLGRKASVDAIQKLKDSHKGKPWSKKRRDAYLAKKNGG